MSVSAVLQLIGALMVLGGFALLQFRVLGQYSYPYLLLNIVGSALLALLLEGGWALVALWGLITRIRGFAPSNSKLMQ